MRALVRGMRALRLATADRASSANLLYPQGLAQYGSAVLYVADTGNQRVRRIELATNIITSVGGAGGVYPSGDWVVPDDFGNLFISAATHVLKFDTSGNLTTEAGTPGITSRQSGGIRCPESLL
jgi:DNA-binding beta-propeller fold protein YncE